MLTNRRNRFAGTGKASKVMSPEARRRKIARDTLYNKSAKGMRNRVLRNNARRKALKKGLVSLGSHKDIDHIKPLKSGGSNSSNNLRVVSRSFNRGRSNKKR